MANIHFFFTLMTLLIFMECELRLIEIHEVVVAVNNLDPVSYEWWEFILWFLNWERMLVQVHNIFR